MWQPNTAIDYPELQKQEMELMSVPGFIDAPDINVKKNMSSPTIPSITSQPDPLNPFLYTTSTEILNGTYIKQLVRQV